MKILLFLFLTSLPLWVHGEQYDFEGITGIIRSGNYPSNYDNNLSDEFTITVPDGYFIHLTFLDFLTEDPYDYLAIQSGIGADAVTLQGYATLAGDQTGLSVTINSTEATLLFKTDLTTTYRGFAIEYDGVQTGTQYTPVNTCSSPLHTSSFGIVTSPNFPDNYPDNKQCSYLLIAPEGSKITLQFVAFNTEDGYDIVYVYDGSNTSYTLIGAFSGKKIPSTISSSGNTLFLTFQSDLVNNFSGFSGLYMAQDNNNEFRRGVLPQDLVSSTTVSSRRDQNILNWLKDKKNKNASPKPQVSIQAV